MNSFVLSLIAFQSLVIFILGLVVGFFVSKGSKSEGKNGRFAEAIDLWRNSVEKIDELTHRVAVQLGSVRERLAKLDRSISNDQHVESIAELTVHIDLLEKEIQSLKSYSTVISDITRTDRPDSHNHQLPAKVAAQPTGPASFASDEIRSTVRRDGEFDAFLAEVRQKVAIDTPMASLLDFVFEELRAYIPCQRMGYAEINYSADRVSAVWHRSDRPCQLKAGYSAALSKSSLRLLTKKHQPRVLNNLPEYLRRHPNSKSTQLIVGEGYQSSLTLPIEVRGTVVAFLFISNVEVNSFDDESVKLAKQVVKQLNDSVHLPMNRPITEPALT